MRRFAITVATLAALSPLHAHADEGPERITDFGCDLTIRKDGGMVVVDTISVMAKGKIIQHGIYFALPTLMTQDGVSSAVAPAQLAVARDGHTEPYELVTEGDAVRLKIGDKNVLLDAGSHTYTVTYSLNWNSLQSVKMLWDATGPGWDMRIDHAHADVRGEPGVTIEASTGYVGTASSVTAAVQSETQPSGHILFNVPVAITPGDALVLAIAFYANQPAKDAI